jgi:hypothetical protein
MTELQEFYNRIHNKTQQRTKTLAACWTPEISDREDQTALSEILGKCGIPLFSMNSLEDVQRCFSDPALTKDEQNYVNDLVVLDESVPNKVLKDVQCAKHEKATLHNEQHDQRKNDLQKLLTAEQYKLGFRLSGIAIIGLYATLS